MVALNKKFRSAQGDDIPIAKKKLEMRKADCANIAKNIDSIKLSFIARDKLRRRQKDLENKIVSIKKKIKRYEVSY